MWGKVDGSTPEKVNKPAKKDRQEYILEADLEYPKELRKKHNKLLILVERLKNGNAEKVNKNLKVKQTYVVDIKYLNQGLKDSWKLEKGASDN